MTAPTQYKDSSCPWGFLPSGGRDETSQFIHVLWGETVRSYKEVPPNLETLLQNEKGPILAYYVQGTLPVVKTQALSVLERPYVSS